jgi:hypothetical protein
VVRSIVLGATLIIALATVANAGVVAPPVIKTNSLITRVAEGCGPGRWRGTGGLCHPFAVHRACPPGYHLGPEGRRCWPNG